MKKIPLTQGKVAFVSDGDYTRLAQLKWCAAKNKKGYWYAVHGVAGGPSVWMHKMVLGLPIGVKGDHINGDTLDNQRHNLRPATTAQNGQNRKRNAQNFSGFKGVWFSKYRLRRPWYARVKANGRVYNLGNYSTAEKAARAYDTAATRLFGEFARPNFP